MATELSLVYKQKMGGCEHWNPETVWATESHGATKVKPLEQCIASRTTLSQYL